MSLLEDGVGLRGHAHKSLRAATRDAHQALDAAFDPAALTTREGYIGFLLGNAPVCAIELGLEQAGIERVLTDWEQRRRRFALARDFAALQVEPPFCRAIAINTDAPTLLGWSYVLEGSRLGAAFICKSIEKYGHAETRAATHFLQHGIDRPHWATFTKALARLDDDPPAIAAACEAARAAFECFATAMTPRAAPGSERHSSRTSGG